jgi:hypothetical protein
VSDEIAVLKLVAGALDAAGIDYMVTGSLALSAYAVPRMTRDVDLVVALVPDDADRLCAHLGDDFDCHPESIRSAIVRGSMFNLIHSTRVVKVDFVVRKTSPFRLEEFARRRRVDVDGQPVWIVSPEDLLLSKLLWGHGRASAVQRADVMNLVASWPIDWLYVERWGRDLGLETEVREIRP